MKLKTIFKNENYILQQGVECKEEPKTYTVDVFDDELYICSATYNGKAINVLYTNVELKNVVENDSINKYEFTKEAYAQCEIFFKRANRVIA